MTGFSIKTPFDLQAELHRDSLGSMVFKDAAALFFELGVVEAALLTPFVTNFWRAIET